MNRPSLSNSRTSIARVLSILAGFALTAVVARQLGPSDSGRFFLVFAGIAVLSTIGRIGTDNLALKISGEDSQNVRNDISAMMRVAFSASLIVGATTSVVGLGTGWGIDHIGALPTVLASTAVTAQALSVFFGAVLRSRGIMATGTFAEIGSTPLISTFGLLAFAWISSVELSDAVAIYASSSIVTLTWSAFAYWSTSRRSPQMATPSRSEARITVRRSLSSLTAMMGTSLLFYLLTWCPVIMLAATVSVEAVSYYTLASRLAMVVALIPAIQVSYLAPQFARLYGSKDLSSLTSLAGMAANQAFSAALVPCLTLVLGAKWVVSLVYGPGFSEAVWPLVILAIANLIVTAFGQVNQLMLLCGLEHFALLLNLALVVAWLTLGLAAGVLAGAVGAAIFFALTSVTYSCSASSKLKGTGIGSRIRLDRGSHR